MPLKSHHYLLIIPILIYIFFAIPSLNEWASGDSTSFLTAADELSGMRQWPTCRFADRALLWHPFLYVLMLGVIRGIFGTNIIFFRLFNMGCCLVSIIFIYLICRKLYRDNKNYFIPLIACLIFSLNPYVIKGSLHIDIDNTLLTTLTLVFIFLFLKYWKCLNTKNMAQLSFIFALLLSTKLGTPLILVFAILSYLLINKKIDEAVHMIKVFIAGFILFFVCWVLYCVIRNFGHYIFFIFKYGGADAWGLQVKYEIFRAVLCISPFFVLLWVLKIIDRSYKIFQSKISGTDEDLIIIISITIFVFYLFFFPLLYGFPKYLFPAIPIMCILIADMAAKVGKDILYNLKTFVVITSIALIYNIILVGDLLYLTSYAAKERFIKSNFDILVLHGELLHILLKIFLLFILFLLIFVFYIKGKRQNFVSAGITSLFIMFISGSLALNIMQYNARYQVIYAYGSEGAKDLVKFLKTRFTSGDRIVAPYEIVYYLGATNTGFIFQQDSNLATPERFIRLLKDVNPTFVVYGISSNTIKQYRDVFSSKMVGEYFRVHNFMRMEVGSYTLWTKADRKVIPN